MSGNSRANSPAWGVSTQPPCSRAIERRIAREQRQRVPVEHRGQRPRAARGAPRLTSSATRPGPRAGASIPKRALAMCPRSAPKPRGPGSRPGRRSPPAPPPPAPPRGGPVPSPGPRQSALIRPSPSASRSASASRTARSMIALSCAAFSISAAGGHPTVTSPRPDPERPPRRHPRRPPAPDAACKDEGVAVVELVAMLLGHSLPKHIAGCGKVDWIATKEVQFSDVITSPLSSGFIETKVSQADVDDPHSTTKIRPHTENMPSLECVEH